MSPHLDGVRPPQVREDKQMERSQLAEEQIIGILREQEAGMNVAELAWNTKFDGLNISDAKPLEQLEKENPRLKKLLGAATRDFAVL
jgi:putative transposase